MVKFDHLKMVKMTKKGHFMALPLQLSALLDKQALKSTEGLAFLGIFMMSSFGHFLQLSC